MLSRRSKRLPDAAHPFSVRPAFMPGLVAIAVLTGCMAAEQRPPPPVMPASADIAATLRDDGRFAEFLAATDGAGLTGMLASDGPFSVFAPLDGAQTGTDGLDAGDHIAAGRLEWADLSGVKARLATLNGRLLEIDTLQPPEIDAQSTLVQADIPATNGIIHVIDRPLSP